MEKLFVSKSTDSVRMFKSDWMEKMSKVHFSVPLIIYIPTIAFLIYKSFELGTGPTHFFMFFGLGIVIWTITEYTLHRWVFHFDAHSKLGKRLVFIFHGVHHDYPQDARRLVMPPSASIPLAILFYFFFSLFFTLQAHLLAFFSGFLLGYLVYDMMHYAFHHSQISNPFFLKLKLQHMQHHYTNPHRGYGVSNMVWDELLHTDFPKKKNVRNTKVSSGATAE